MCGGIAYQYPHPETRQKQARKMFFPRPHAEIPVLGDDGARLHYQWGHRSKEEGADYEVSVIGWARADKLESGYCKHYHCIGFV